jgi:hypothetical protein
MTLQGFGKTLSERQFRVGRVIILGLFLILSLAYGIINPAFESPDEIFHFDYVEEILRTQRLPVAEKALSEYHQPPLYYAAGAALTAWLPPGHPASALIERNLFWPWRIGEVGVDNKSQFLHGPEQLFPWHGLWLRLHLVRILTTFLGLVAVWATCGLALLIWPRQFEIALMAAATVAFLPQFLYLASSVSNDVPSVALSAVVLLLLGQVMVAPGHKLMRVALLGVALGCSVLVKMSMLLVTGLVIGILVLYVFLNWRSARGRPASDRTRDGPAPAARHGFWLPVAALLGETLVAGPYLWRNWLIYGDPTALARMDAIWGVRNPPLTLLAMVPDELFNIWSSFWARFGYGQIPVPNWIYELFMVAVVAVVLAAIYAVVQQALRREWDIPRLLLFVAVALLFVGFSVATVRYAQTSRTGSYGRFAFPALPAIAVVVGVGWAELGARIKLPGLIAVIAGAGTLCLVSIWALFGILRPAYVLPTTPLALGSAQGAIRLDDAALAKVSLLTPVLAPGEDALVQVDWVPLRATQVPLIFVLNVKGPNGELLGERLSYPGQGRTSTTFWQPGASFREIYRVPIDAQAATQVAPARVSVSAWLYNRPANVILPVYGADTGQALSPPLVAQGKLPPAASRATGVPPAAIATFGDTLQLNAVHFPATAKVGSTIAADLEWTVRQPAAQDLKLFLHLVPMDGDAQVAQSDALILGGRYPVSLWTPGEQLHDRHELQVPADLAPGNYRLRIGLYPGDAWTARLPVSTAGGIASDVLDIGMVDVEK